MKPMEPMKPMAPMAPMAPMHTEAEDWWPKGLSHPGSSGAQNGMRYAFFAEQRRLVIEQDGDVVQYDTGDLQISGVSQQQSGGHGGSPRFTSQDGEVALGDLKRL